MIRRFCLALLAACALPLVASAQLGPPQDRYIVVLNEGLDLPEDVAADVALRTGGRVGYVYDTVLRGFSITMPRAALASVERDPRVDYVEEDKPVTIFAQTVPTGIQRIFADDNINIGIDGTDDRVDADVAVLDTGIDWSHPDLYVVGGANCLNHTGGPPFSRTYFCEEDTDGSTSHDGHSHGTHVAGTVGAIDNDIGVVGVAPGVRLWAVKVLDDQGSGSFGGIIAGIDWVAAKENDANPIEVINMSLGGSGTSQAVNDAIDAAVNNYGVTVVVAAGNSDDDAEGYTPANAPESFTISALADFDGEPEGNGSPTCRTDEDDTLANFSNWDDEGDIIEIAAPGVCILSTVPGNDYDTFSGTSMASPHAAGAAALLASAHDYGGDRDGADVDAIRNALVAEGNSNWLDDSGDGIQEPLLDVSDATVFAPVFGGGGGGGGDGNSAPVASFTYSCDTTRTCNFDGTESSDSDGSITHYHWDFGDGDAASGATLSQTSHTYDANGTYTVILTVTDDGDATDSESKDVSVSDGTGDPNEIYVWAIEMSHKDYGPGGSFKDLETTIYIKRDSDGDGMAESGDDWAGNADVTVQFEEPDGDLVTLSVQTDSQGSGTIIRKRIETGEHTVTVTNVTHSTYTYDSSLNVEASDSHFVD